jgi:hypothetical protein
MVRVADDFDMARLLADWSGAGRVTFTLEASSASKYQHDFQKNPPVGPKTPRAGNRLA